MSSAASPILTAAGLKKAYGKVAVLRGVDLTIQQGELVAITGPSGAGKSTLLHILGTLDRPDAGTLELKGKDILALRGDPLARLRNQHFGFVFQAHHLLPAFTAEENVAMPAWLAGKTHQEGLLRAHALLDLLGLAERRQHKPTELSGGEQQRVAVARALVNKPTVVLADEPSGSLDAARADQLHQLFLRLRKELGQTFIFATHNPNFAATADRVVALQEGYIVPALG